MGFSVKGVRAKGDETYNSFLTLEEFTVGGHFVSVYDGYGKFG